MDRTVRKEPIVNLPGAVSVFLLLIVGIHCYREFLLTPRDDLLLVLKYAFIPLRYAEGAREFPGGQLGDLWSVLTYGLLHGNWGHLLTNCLWLAVFGTPLAIRFGTLYFVLFSALCTAAGALAHQIAFPDEFAPIVGASAAISGYMAAAARFVFDPRGPLALGQGGSEAVYKRPALPLIRALQNRQIMIFVLIWFAMNFLFAFGIAGVDGRGPQVAWQAHIGGFVAGFILFPLFDPVGPRTGPVAPGTE